MKNILINVVVSLVVITLTILGFVFCPPNFSVRQMETFYILLAVLVGAIAYCFIVGELTRNNSQMDKLWSLLPIAYAWIIAAKGEMSPRLVLFAIIVTLWGIRLTVNFGRKGAYSLKFWSGEEDYRWQVLRQKPVLGKRPVWALFDLLFISTYQNALVLAICLPALACMDSNAPLGTFDYLATGLALSFLLLETAADEQQMAFHTTKKKLLESGKPLSELPSPFNLGFNTTGLWAYFRHPNYLGEQGVWISLYLFCIGAGVANYGIFNYSMAGPLLLVLLFLGSAAFGEGVSASKYPEYEPYQKRVFKYLPLRKYHRPEE